jgi:hypothetical protein
MIATDFWNRHECGPGSSLCPRRTLLLRFDSIENSRTGSLPPVRRSSAWRSEVEALPLRGQREAVIRAFAFSIETGFSSCKLSAYGAPDISAYRRWLPWLRRRLGRKITRWKSTIELEHQRL